MSDPYDDDRFDPQDDGRETTAPGADPDCRYCGGRGYVCDSVDWWGATVTMRTGCECVVDPDEDDGQPSDQQEQNDFAHDDDFEPEMTGGELIEDAP